MVRMDAGPRWRQVRWGMVLWSSLALAACASLAPAPRSGEEFLKHHYVLAHEDGFAISTEKRLVHETLASTEARADIEKRVFSEGVDAHARQLWPSVAENQLVTGEPLQILVFVHGGLNGYRDDFDRMRRMLARPEDCPAEKKPSRLFVSAACPNARTRYYPIFVNWNSELFDSIGDDLFFIRFARRRPELGWVTWPFVLGARLAEAIFSAPNGWYANAESFFDGEPDALDWLEGIPTVPIRFLTTPIVKAFGTSAWQIMKRRAGLVAAPRLEDPEREGAAWSLLSALAERIEMSGDAGWWKMRNPRGAKVPVEITLVGHSMGAIVLNRLLAASVHLDHRLPVKRIVYLAPAASINDVEAAVQLFRQANREVEFWTFMLQHKDESRERHWSQLPPRGTLLVWVDNFFEPIAEQGDTRFGRSKSYNRYYHIWPREATDRKGGIVCDWDDEPPDRPTKHGQVGALPHLEVILWQVNQKLFDARVPTPQITLARCPSIQVVP